MKVNPTVALTFTLLTLMLGAGLLTGAWGFAIGREALKGITQPDARPTNKGAAQNSSVREDLVLLKEEIGERQDENRWSFCFTEFKRIPTSKTRAKQN